MRCRACLVLTALGWLASLALPAVTIGAGDSGPTVVGWILLRRGWEATGSGIYAWYANPLFLAAWCVAIVGYYRLAAAAAVFAVGLALSSFVAGDLARASGLPVAALTFHSGFYLWLAAIASMFVTAVLCAIAVHRGRRERP